MGYCNNCRTQIDECVKFCPSCGIGVRIEQEAQNNKAMGALSYLGILVLVPIFTAKASSFVRYHANQGLILLFAEVGYTIIRSTLFHSLPSTLFGVAWGAWGVTSAVLGLVWLVFPVFSIIGIVNAVNGKCSPLPVIGQFTLLK